LDCRAHKPVIPFDERCVPILKKLGLYQLLLVPYIKTDPRLITALVERWRPETHTFHLPNIEYIFECIFICGKVELEHEYYCLVTGWNTYSIIGQHINIEVCLFKQGGGKCYLYPLFDSIMTMMLILLLTGQSEHTLPRDQSGENLYKVSIC
jgi:hypothetical protein